AAQARGTARPGTTSAPGSRARSAPRSRILADRVPAPITTDSTPTTAWSTQIGIPSGRPGGVTPPISIPVSSTVRSAGANDTFFTPRRRLTVPLTSTLVVARATQAAWWPAGRLDATRMVLADSPGSTPYASQNAAVSARSGSQSMIS